MQGLRERRGSPLALIAPHTRKEKLLFCLLSWCRLRVVPIGVVLVLVGAAAPTRAAVVFDLALTAESELVPSVGAAEPLTGTLRIWIDDVSGTVPTLFRVAALDVAAGDVTAVLDREIPSAGLGVLFPDESFVLPTLFLVLDAGAGPFALAIPDVEGTAELDGSFELRVETSFAIAAGDPIGLVTVNLVAVPEPSGALAALVSLLLVAAVKKGAGFDSSTFANGKS